MNRIYSFPVDALGDPEDIIVQGKTRKIMLRQKDRTGTLLPFNLYGPTGDEYEPFDAGETAIIERGVTFAAGQKAGRIETVSGSADFVQVETFG